MAIRYDSAYRPLYPSKRYIPSKTPAVFTLIAETGSYTVSLQDVSFRYFHLNADVGIYAIVGSPSILAFELNTVSGSYSITGSDAALAKGQGIVVDAGSYTVTGQVAGLSVELNAAVGSYTLTGTNTPILGGFKVIPDSGIYALTGVDAGLIFTPTGGGPTLHLLACLGAGN